MTLHFPALKKALFPWGESAECKSQSEIHVLWFHFTFGQEIETFLEDKLFKLSFSQNQGII